MHRRLHDRLWQKKLNFLNHRSELWGIEQVWALHADKGTGEFHRSLIRCKAGGKINAFINTFTMRFNAWHFIDKFVSVKMLKVNEVLLKICWYGYCLFEYTRYYTNWPMCLIGVGWPRTCLKVSEITSADIVIKACRLFLAVLSENNLLAFLSQA